VTRDLAKLKICFLAGTLAQGGAERQLIHILKALRCHGADVRLLCLTQGEFWEETIRKMGIPITWVGQEKSKVARLKRILTVLKESPPDIIQSHHFYTNLYATAAAHMLGSRDLGSLRNDPGGEMKFHGFVTGRLSLRAPHWLVSNSRAAMHRAEAFGVPSSRLRWLPNVVDLDRFYPCDCAHKGPLRLLSVGRLEEQKRHDRLLTVFKRQISRSGTRAVRLTIVGEGSERSRLEGLARDLGLARQVEFRGAVAETDALYRESDIFVLTSDWEGTPNVILEAMASGLPVVATRVGGVPEIVQHGVTGYLVDPGDENALAEALSILIGDCQLRREMGRRARRYVEENHSPQRLGAFLQELYEAALS